MKEIKKMISKYNFSSRNGNTIKYIVIHDTGNTTDTARNNANYFGGGNRNASAHYFVDNNEMVQVVEDTKSSWHCGDGNGRYGITNQNSIGIEMCRVNNDVTSITEENTVELVKYLMKKYNISIENVVRHYDASRKNCPSSFNKGNWKRWNEFKNKLKLNNQNNNSHNCNCKYHGIVTCDVLNVRNKPNTSDSEIIGQLKKDDKVSIIEKENNWYKIIHENHVAYVSADYIKLEEEINKPVETPIEDNRVLWHKIRKYDSDIYYAMLDPKTQECVITKGNNNKFEKPSTIKTINGKEVEIISNLGFFSWETGQESLGMYLSNGTCDSYNSSSYYNFGLTYDGKFNIFYYKDKLSNEGISDLKKVYKWIASAPIQLIKDRKIDVQYKDNGFKDICNCIAPRTAIGSFKDGRVVLICIDGRNKDSKGVTCQELAKIGYDLGLYQMVSVDGGGSSALVCKGEVVNKPSDGNERAVGSMIAFIKK